MTDAEPLTDAQRARADRAVEDLMRGLAQARAAGRTFPDSSPGKFSGPIGYDDDLRKFPTDIDTDTHGSREAPRTTDDRRRP